MAARWQAHPDYLAGARVFGRGRILPDVSQASGFASADVYRRVRWFGRSAAGMAACFQGSAFEANLFDENNGFLVAASVFPYFYALVGERNPKLAPKAGSRSPYSALACDAFELITREGPISNQKMQEVLGGSVSFPALDGALELGWGTAAGECRESPGRGMV